MALALEVQQHDDQQGNDEGVVPAFLEGLPGAGKFVPLETLQAAARGIRIDLHEQAGIEEEGRDDGGKGDLGVGRAQELGHHESRGAHHRRRQDRARRGAGLDGPGVGGAEAGPLHGGNRHGARGEDIADDAAGHHAEQARGEDADLGGAAAERTAQREREVDEELAGAGHHEGRAEHQEPDDDIGEGLDRYAEQALRGEHVVGGGLIERRLVALERPEPRGAGEQRIDREGEDAQEQAPAARPSQRLHEHDPHQVARPDHGFGRIAELPSEFGGLADVDHQVERGDGRSHEQHDIVPGDPVDRGPGAARKDHEGEGQHAENQEVEVLRVERRESDEEAQGELLVDAEKDGDRRQCHEQPPPHAGERAGAQGLGLGRTGLVRVVQNDPHGLIGHDGRALYSKMTSIPAFWRAAPRAFSQPSAKALSSDGAPVA